MLPCCKQFTDSARTFTAVNRQPLRSPALAAAAVAAAEAFRVDRHTRPFRRLAAAADTTADGNSFQLDTVVPHFDRRASKLQGRTLPHNPLQWIWQASANAALHAELLFSAVVDRLASPYIMSALAGSAVALGLDAAALVQHGLPPYVSDLLLFKFGLWDTGLCTAALIAGALPVTVWALRAWWRANMLLLQRCAALLLSQQQQVHTSAADQPIHQQQQQQEVVLTGVAAVLTLLRGGCIASVANNLLVLLFTKGASSTAVAMSAAAAVTAAAAAVLPLLLLLRQQTNSNSSSSSQLLPVLGCLLAADAAWVTSILVTSLFVRPVAGLVLAGSLFMLHSRVVTPAVQQYRAAAGDWVEVHVGLRLGGTRPLFDSTLAEEPLRLQVAALPTEFVQQWQAACSAGADDTPPGAQQQQQDKAQEAAGGQSSRSRSSSSSSSLHAGGDGEVRDAASQQHKQRTDHQGSRWEVLQPFVAQAAEGLLLGETRCMPLSNPGRHGYSNPSFTWWQPAADVAEKFKGNMPDQGDVFWYPVAPGAAVLTRVNAVGRDFVELDANYGVRDADLELQVQLVRLQKPAQK